ncbi:TPA: trypsin-like serine protease, partial [Serratia marcescens]
MKGKTMNILTVLRGGGLAALLFLSSLVPTATALTGSAPQTPSPPVLAVQHTGVGIINGQPAGNLTPKWIALIGQTHTDETIGEEYISGVCTGSFVTKRLVLTALHCLLDEDKKLLNHDRFRVAGGSGVVADLSTNYVDVTDIITLGDQTDIALLKLGNDYPNIETAPLYHGAGYRFKNDVLLMGFGLTSQDPQQEADKLYMTTMQLSWPQTGMDLLGGLALLLKVDSKKGITAPGDSGGPALLALFNESQPSDFKKLIGVLSGTSPGDDVVWPGRDSYTLISSKVLDWLSQSVGSIISYPVDEQVFDTATQTIMVRWYGSAPDRVDITDRNNPARTGHCQPAPGSDVCILDVSSLFSKTTQQVDYDISAVRKDGSADTVTVRFDPVGIPLSIESPPKLTPFYIYQPDAGSVSRYTVQGRATPDSTLRALLIHLDREELPLTAKQNTSPCQDDNNQPLAAITTDEQGVWVCNVAISEQDKQQYRFDIALENPPDGRRAIDSVNFQVNAGNERVTIDPLKPWVPYVDNGMNFVVSGISVANSVTVTEPTMSQGWQSPADPEVWASKIPRPQIDDMSISVQARMYRNKDKVEAFPYLLPEPDSIASKTITFVDAALTRPMQTMVDEKASVITTIKTRGYTIREHLDLRGNSPVTHAIDAIKIQYDGEAKQITTLCQSELRTGDWECPAVTLLESGDYHFTDFVESDGSRIPSRQVLVHIIAPPLFIYPEQSEQAGTIKIIQRDPRGLMMKGVIPVTTAAWAKKRKPSGSVDGTVTVYPLDDEGKKGEVAGRCDITVIADEKSETRNNWACTRPIKLPQLKADQNQAYQAEVQLNSREDADDIGGITRFTLVPPAAVTVTTPQAGKRVTTEAVTPSGTGEKKQKLDIQLMRPSSQVIVRDGGSECPARVPTCSTTVGDKGKWQCPPEAVTEEGEYTVKATECDGDKVLSEDSSTFTVKHNECPSGY